MLGESFMDVEAKSAEDLLLSFQSKTRLRKVDYEIADKSGMPYLVIFLANPTERFFKALNESIAEVGKDNLFYNRATLKRRAAVEERLNLPETSLLRILISENLTAAKSSIEKGEFSSRYIETVDGSEQQLSSHSNHIVYGRRGAGKSSLLLYLVNQLEQQGKLYSWVPMQTYSGRKDGLIAADIIIEILRGLISSLSYKEDVQECIRILEGLADIDEDKGSELKFNRVITRVRRALGEISRSQGGLFVFLDDIHVLKELQPRVLSRIYSLARDNGVYLKISGVQSFSKLHDPATREGLEAPGDIQIINLDQNLTMPDKSFEHIKRILDSYALYSALPNISYICGKGVLERLIWVAAGVPRDALNLFSKSISKAFIKGQKRVSITSINSSGSEMADDKLRDVEKDATGDFDEIKETLEKAKNFCIREKKKNAFLVEISPNNSIFKKIDELVALRFLHILHEGVTPSEAGKRYKALMLDYGFYVGFRAARSVDLFQESPTALSARQLRVLPIFPLNLASSK